MCHWQWRQTQVSTWRQPSSSGGSLLASSSGASFPQVTMWLLLQMCKVRPDVDKVVLERGGFQTNWAPGPNYPGPNCPICLGPIVVLLAKGTGNWHWVHCAFDNVFGPRRPAQCAVDVHCSWAQLLTGVNIFLHPRPLFQQYFSRQGQGQFNISCLFQKLSNQKDFWLPLATHTLAGLLTFRLFRRFQDFHF